MPLRKLINFIRWEMKISEMLAIRRLNEEEPSQDISIYHDQNTVFASINLVRGNEQERQLTMTPQEDIIEVYI
jgi:hypothetical protein